MPQTLRRNDAEFGHMSAQGIDQHRALPDQKTARSMQHQHRLLLGVLYRHEPHRRAGYGFADRFRIGGIVLVALDVGQIGAIHPAVVARPQTASDEDGLVQHIFSAPSRLYRPNSSGTVP